MAGSPSPFRFAVDLGKGIEARFSQVAGLQRDPALPPVRGSPSFPAIDLPRLGRVGNLVLKRGLTDAGSSFWTWLGNIELGTVRRRTVTIIQLDASGAPGLSWTLSGALPLELTGAAPRDDGQIAIGSLRLAYRAPAAVGQAR